MMQKIFLSLIAMIGVTLIAYWTMKAFEEYRLAFALWPRRFEIQARGNRRFGDQRNLRRLRK